MGKGSKWDLKKVNEDAFAIGEQLKFEEDPQGPASTVTRAQVQYLMNWVRTLAVEELDRKARESKTP